MRNRFSTKQRRRIGEKLICTALALILAVVPFVGLRAEDGAQPTAGPLAQPPLLMKYDEPATSWETNANPLGNGFLGIEVFGGVKSDRIMVNEHTLWSGGPGADASYNGGHNSNTPAQNAASLAKAQELIQKEMTDFTENSAAYVDGSGNVITKNYKNSAEMKNAIYALKGEKSHFGSYQQLSDIFIDDYVEGQQKVRVVSVKTNSANDSITSTEFPEKAAKAFDGDPGTKWYSRGGLPEGSGVVQEFPVWATVEYNRPVTTAAYAIMSGNDAQWRDPKAWKLYGSNDGVDFDLIDEQTNVTFSGRKELKSFPLAEEKTYQHYKIEVTELFGGNTDGIQMQELYINYQEEIPAKITSIESNSANSGQSRETVELAFDNNLTTKWYSVGWAPGGAVQEFPVWVTVGYDKPMKTSRYAIVSGNDTPARDPKAWKLYGSNDKQIFTVIDERTDVEFANRKELKIFTLQSEQTYQYYKLEFSELYGTAPGIQMQEIYLNYDKQDPMEGVTDYRRVLDLDEAVETVSYTKDDIRYTREYFVSNPDNMIAVRLTADKEGSLSKCIRLATGQTAVTLDAQGDTITLTGSPADHTEAEKLLFAQQVKVIPRGGKLTAEEGEIFVSGANEILILSTAGTNYQQCMDDTFDYFSDEDPLDGVKARIDTSVQKGYEALRQAHVEDYKELYDRVKLNIGASEVPAKMTDNLLKDYKAGRNTAGEDRYLETLYYQFGRYLLIASSREGSLPANLQGIWADGLTPPWDADYHTNINVQMNYWLAEQTNLKECHTPVIDYINSLVPRGTYTAKQLFGEDTRGWLVFHENNIWGNTAPGTWDTAFWTPTAAGWLCQDIWEMYDFNRDRAFLEKNYNTMLQAALCLTDILVTDTRDNTLVISPSYSPEHYEFSIGCTFDQTVVWDCFNNVLQAAEILGKTEDSGVKEIRDAFGRLSMPKIGLNGQFQEWKDETTTDVTGDGGHRHVNHLYPLHPGRQIIPGRSEQEDQYIAAMRKTLETRGDGGTGWSKAWKINFWARLRDGDHAHKMVSEQLKDSTYDNLFDAHPPFQIDGNFGATAGMNEMLIQSHGDAVELLPASCEAWAEGSVSGVRARGNIDVDMEWSEREITKAVLKTGTAAEALKVKAANIAFASITDGAGQEVDYKVVDANTVTFRAEEGETYTINRDPGFFRPPLIIAAKPQKNAYTVGEELSLDGIRLAVKKDGGYSEVQLSDCTVSANLSKEGKAKVYLLYIDQEGIAYKNLFTVTVFPEPAVRQIVLAAKPTKLYYEQGDELLLDGLKVLAKYTDGRTAELPLSDLNVSGFDSAVPGVQKLTVKYKDLEQTTGFSIRVG